MKRDKPRLRKGDPDSNFSFHIIYREIIRIHRGLPICLIFQNLGVFLKFKKGEQRKQRY